VHDVDEVTVQAHHVRQWMALSQVGAAAQGCFTINMKLGPLSGPEFRRCGPSSPAGAA
jgi:hypothetical protein